EARERVDPEADLDERRECAERADVRPADREDEAQEPGRDGQEDQDRDDPGVHQRTRMKTRIRAAMPNANASAYARRRPVCRRPTARPVSRVSIATSVGAPRMTGRSIQRLDTRASHTAGL